MLQGLFSGFENHFDSFPMNSQKDFMVSLFISFFV